MEFFATTVSRSPPFLSSVPADLNLLCLVDSSPSLLLGAVPCLRSLDSACAFFRGSEKALVDGGAQIRILDVYIYSALRIFSSYSPW